MYSPHCTIKDSKPIAEPINSLFILKKTPFPTAAGLMKWLSAL